MLKELDELKKQLANNIADQFPIIFKKRARRRLWAGSLPEEMGTKLYELQVRPEDSSTDVKYSALGWACALYASANQKCYATDDKIVIDGISYTVWMPEQIRRWYGIEEMAALKLQALQLNGSDRKKLQKFILEL